jgi:peptide/nickel transport system permease protein
VWDLYLEKLPGTMILALVSLAVGAAGGILLGVTAARHEGRPTDTFITVVASVGFSVPSYFAAVACIWFFTVAFDFGLRPTGYILEDKVFEPGVSLQLKNLVLPVLTLAVRPLGTITLITRERMCDILRQPYVLAARAHGLPYGRIVWIFALKNAAIPLAASLSGWLAALLTGAFFIEFLFDWQGVGRLLVDGLLNNDFPLVSGCCLATATIFIVIHFLTDRFYLWADPVQRK